MTLYCLDCGSSTVIDTDAPWDAGKIPTCPFCADPLRDRLGVLLTRDADRGWCHSTHRHERKHPIDYASDRWDWRDRDVFDHADTLPLAEAAELAAHAQLEPPETAPMEDRR